MIIPKIILINETIEKFGYNPETFIGRKDYNKPIIRICLECKTTYKQQFINAIRSFKENKKCKFCTNKERAIICADSKSILMKNKVKDGKFIPPMLGKKHTQEVKDKAKRRLEGKTFEELYGKEKADKIKKKASDNFSGEKNPFYGKHHTKETIDFLRENSTKTTKRGKQSNFYGKNNNLLLTTEEWIKKSVEKHGDLYDYSLSNYLGTDKPIDIICKTHGLFTQIANTHTSSGCGCPICKYSKGEIFIQNYLNVRDIKFEPQFRFEKCKNKNTLPFDFYLPNYNLCIEYDGEFHYIDKFGGLEQQKINDEIKNNFCIKENIKLIRIPYTEFNKIEIILNENL